MNLVLWFLLLIPMPVQPETVQIPPPSQPDVFCHISNGRLICTTDDPDDKPLF